MKFWWCLCKLLYCKVLPGK